MMANYLWPTSFGNGTVLGIVEVANFPAIQEVNGTVGSSQVGDWEVGRTWDLSYTTDSVTAYQGTSPWVISGAVSQSGTWSVGRTWTLSSGIDSVTVTGNIAISNFPTTQSVTQGTSPWVVSGTIEANQNGTWSVGRTWTLASGTDSVTVFQGTSPWVVSGTVTANIGTTNGLALNSTVSALQVSQGSSTSGQQGSLMLGAVTTSAPTYTTGTSNAISLTTAGALRVDASGTTQPISGTVTALQGTSPWVVSGTVASTQSGTWTTGRTWTLASGTDSVSCVQSTSPWVISGNVNATQSGTWTVQQGTPPWSVSQSGSWTVAATQSGTWTTGRTWTLASGTDSVSAVQSGTWNITNISGTISLPTGASTSALQTAGNTSLASILANQTNGSQIVATKTPLTASSPTSVSVGIASTAVIAASTSTLGFVFVNNSVNVISFGIGVAAVLYSGITLYPGGTWVADEYTFTQQAINAIASAASSTLGVQVF